MATMDIREAEQEFDRLVEALLSGVESEVIITRDGKPVTKLVPIHALDLPDRRNDRAAPDFSTDAFDDIQT